MDNDKKVKDPLTNSIYNKQNLQYWFQVKRYYALNYDFFEMEPHTHKEFEVMYAVNGSCAIFYWTKENARKELLLKEGEYVVIDCQVRHQLEVARGSKCRILNLEISIRPQREGMRLQQFYEQSQSLQDFLRLNLPIFKGYDDASNLHTIITELHKQLESSEDKAENRIQQNLILAQLLIELGRQRKKKHQQESGGKYVKRALLYLSDHFEQDIKINKIAGEIGISASYLQRLFKEQTGKTLVDKLNELRIEKAKILLETSRLPIIDIAVSVGFNNRQHFTYTFLKLTGSSPATYRKHKGNYLVFNGF